MSADYIDRTEVNRYDTAVLAIDPGINGTGWSMWQSVPPKMAPSLISNVPSEVGVLRKRFGSFVDAATWIADEVYAVTGRARWYCPVHRQHWCGCGKQPQLIVTCEFPEFQTSAARSMGWMRGDLQKLTFLTGVLARAVTRHTNHDIQQATFEPVPVSQWKGQLPKDVVQRRIEKELGLPNTRNLDIKTHAWDAVGIGLWRLGVFE